MQHEILAKPDFPIIKVNLDEGDTIQAETGAMVAMSQNVKIKTAAKGGILKSAKRAVMGGESFFQNTFSSEGGPGELYLTSATMGDISHRQLNNEELILSTGAYVAGSTDLVVDSKWGGFKALFSGEGLFFLKVSGTGDLFFSSFGAIHEVDISGDYIVDTGHIVGFETSLNYKIEKVGGLKSLFLSGEGIVCRFSGSGKLYLQTRNQGAFAFWANQWRRTEGGTTGKLAAGGAIGGAISGLSSLMGDD